MNTSFLPAQINRGLSAAALALLLASSTCHAEIYKWVDANGRTHYSERREDAGKAKTVDLKVMTQPTTAPAAKSAQQNRLERERQVYFRQAQKSNERDYEPPAAATPKSLSGGISDETDASRCNLARDVISGAVRHPNGLPTDDYDRKIAENDIRTYCR